MPHKITQTVEYCWPCIWHKKEMLMSGREPIYSYNCMHPSQPNAYIGRAERPPWCPIRGDAKAEKEAEQDITRP